jgi:ATP-dependent DNA ligase
MLARSGRLPTNGDYAYEVKWDGFRTIVSTEDALRVRSRRGWDMAERLGFLEDLPARGVFDGELVALDADGKPDFPELCERVLPKRSSAPRRSSSSTCSNCAGETRRVCATRSDGRSLMR